MWIGTFFSSAFFKGTVRSGSLALGSQISRHQSFLRRFIFSHYYYYFFSGIPFLELWTDSTKFSWPFSGPESYPIFLSFFYPLSWPKFDPSGGWEGWGIFLSLCSIFSDELSGLFVEMGGKSLTVWQNANGSDVSSGRKWEWLDGWLKGFDTMKDR